MIRIISFFFVFFSFVFCSCGSDGYDQRLVLIDSLVSRDLVDSAYNAINSISDASFMKRPNKAYYYLLKSEIQFRKREIIENDSMIDYSIAYYSDSDDKHKLVRAYYVKGKTMFERGNCKDGTTFLLYAKDISEDLDDNLLKCKIYLGLMYNNMEALEYENALKYGMNAVFYSKRINDIQLIVHTLINYSVAQGYCESYDSSLFYAKECLPYINKVNIEDKALVYLNIAAAYENIDVDKAIYYSNLTNGAMPLANSYYILAASYMKKDTSFVLVDSCFNRALELCKNDGMRSDILKDRALYYKEKGIHAKANDLFFTASNVRDSFIERVLNDSILYAQEHFDTDSKINELSGIAFATRILAFLLSVVLGAVLLFVLFYRRRVKLEQVRKESELELVRIEKAEIEKDRQKIEREKMLLIEQNEAKTAEILRLQREQRSLSNRYDNAIDAYRRDMEEMVSRGHRLYCVLFNGGRISLWSNDDFRSFFRYIDVVDSSFMEGLKSNNSVLSNNQRMYLYLSFKGMSDSDIMCVMGLSLNSFRVMRSRLKKRFDSSSS